MTTKYTQAPAQWSCARDVMHMGSSWDAWVDGRNISNDYGVSSSMWNAAAHSDVTLTYGYRQPLKSDGSSYVQNWTYDQGVFDDQLKQLGEMFMWRWVLAYPNRADISSGAVPAVSDINDNSIGLWLSSTYKHKAKLALVIFSDWSSYDASGINGGWLNWPAEVTRWVNLALDPYYPKVTYGGIANRPVFGLYNNGTPTWQGNLAHLAVLTTAITNAGLGTPVYVQMNADATAANAIPTQYITSYIPSIPAATHSTYLALMNDCKKQNLTNGANMARTGYVAQKFDDRPRSTVWADLPLYSQSEQMWRDTYASARARTRENPLAFIHMNSLSEVDESEAFFMTPQDQGESVNTPARGPSVEAIINVRNKTFPTTWTDYYMAWTFHADVGGSLPAGWALVQDLPGTGGTNGSREYAVIRNSTTTNARTWTTTTTRYQVFATVGPGQGHLGVILDGGVQTDINCDDGSGITKYNQSVYDSGAISDAPHTLAVARISGAVEFCRVAAKRH